eukprot:118745_1
MTAKLKDRARIFVVGITLSIWLFIIDGLHYSLNFKDDNTTVMWTKVSLMISGYFFCVFTFIGSSMILFWFKPRIGTLFVVFTCLSAGTLRFIAAIIGLQIFNKESVMDSMSNGITDVVIIMLQIYLLFDVIVLYRHATDTWAQGYMKIHCDDSVIDVNEDSIQNHSNPFNHEPGAFNDSDNDQEYMKAYD